MITPPQVGDVVYCADASAILGDVIAVDGLDVTVRWRATETVENAHDLVLTMEPDPETAT